MPEHHNEWRAQPVISNTQSRTQNLSPKCIWEGRELRASKKALLHLALKTLLHLAFLEEHDFSRAANTGEIVAALASEVCS
jgi:hypothetical protein